MSIFTALRQRMDNECIIAAAENEMPPVHKLLVVQKKA